MNNRQPPYATIAFALGLAAAAALVWTRARRSEADVDARTASRLGMRP